MSKQWKMVFYIHRKYGIDICDIIENIPEKDMLKIEFVWRELLYQAIDCQNPAFSITNLSKKFKLSTSMISHALKPLREMNMIKVGKLNSGVIDAEKLLYFWATRRNLQKDIIYSTLSTTAVGERESLMPADVVPTAYSAYKQIYKEAPADYDAVYYYAQNSTEIEKRFPHKQSKNPNIFVLQSDMFLKAYTNLPTAQLFVDLWNAKEWYARDFSNELFNKIKSKLGL